MAFNLDQYTSGDEAKLYDFLKNVWERARKRFGRANDPEYAFAEEPGRVNLLGARGFRDGVPVENKNDIWDDTLFVIYKEGETKRVRKFKYSSEFGTAGTALLNVGQHKYQLGFHRNSHTDENGNDINFWKSINTAGYEHGGRQYRVLIPYGFSYTWNAQKGWYVKGGSSAGVEVIRDLNRSLGKDDSEALEMNTTIHIHYGGANENSTGNWSEGCQVVQGWSNYKDLIRLVESDTSIRGGDCNDLAPLPAGTTAGNRALIYTLVEGAFLVPVSQFYYPVKLNGELAVGERTAEQYYTHTEKTHRGGYFPIGVNTVWHGGLHIHAGRGTPVHAIADGRVLAARLAPDANGEAYYGSRNFILLRHEIDGGTIAAASRGKVNGYTVQIANLNLRSSPGAEPALGKLSSGDVLDRLDGPEKQHGSYMWLPVKVKTTGNYLLQGKTGYVAYKPEWLKERYENEGASSASAGSKKVYYSLYMHVNQEPIEDTNERLRPVSWIRGSGSTGYRTKVANLPMRNNPRESEPWFIMLKKSAELAYVDPQPAGEKQGNYNWVYVRVSGGDAAAAGKSGWIPAQPGWVETLTGVGLRADLVNELKAGGIVNVANYGEINVRGGETLWLVGEYGSPEYRAGLIHWEIFSAENLMPHWKAASDTDEDFNMDCHEILDLVDQDWFGRDDLLTKEEIDRFFTSDPDALLLREWACQFVSEWAVNLDIAIPKMKGVWFTGHLKERISPYLWWDEVAAKGVPLPENKKVWHYNGIALLKAWSADSPPPPAPPAGSQTDGQEEIHVTTPWYSQYESGHGYTPGDTACFKACVAMAAAAGATVLGPDHRIQVATSEDSTGKVTIDPAKAQQGRAYIDSELEAGRPVVVGVSHKDAAYNVDQLTDHFVVVTGRKKVGGDMAYIFHDPGTSNAANGKDTREMNRFVVESSGKMVRSGTAATGYIYNRHLEVAMVRKNAESQA